MANIRMEMSDADLVANAQEGNAPAFDELVKRHRLKLLRLATRFVRNESDAQDVVQVAFIAAWKNLAGFEGRSQVASWLHRVTVNAALMFLRTRRRHPGILMEDLTGISPDDVVAILDQIPGLAQPRNPFEEARYLELLQRILDSVDALPLCLHEVFICRMAGFSVEKTAQALNISNPSVKTRLHRARLALHQEMKGYLAV